MPLPETIEAGLADGTYKHAHDPILAGGVDDTGEYVAVGYYVPFEYRRDFIRQALGVSGPASGGTVWETNPPRECEIDGCTGMYGFGCRWSATGELFTNTDGDPISYSDVQVVIQYRTPFYTWSGYEDPYFLHSISPSPAENELLLWATQEVETRSETINLPDRNLVWASGDVQDQATGTQAGFDVDYLDLAVTFQKVPYIPRSLGAFKNCVNVSPFLGYGTGKVWFRGYRTEMKSWVGGVRTRSVQLRFNIREEAEWNKRLDKNLQWNYVGVEVPGSEQYDYYDGVSKYYRLPRRYVDMADMLRLQFLAASVPYESITA